MRKALILAALGILAFVGAGALLQQPARATSRRPLTPGEVLGVSTSGPGTADWRLRFLEGIGVSSKLSLKELDYFRSRGTDETFLLRYLAEFGVTPEESEALAAEGVDMALADATKMDVFHWAALADMVVAGEVKAVRGDPKGPYHTHVELGVGSYLKDATGKQAGEVTGALLRTGPRIHAGPGDVHQIEAMEEPDLKEGERVILFLSRTPLNLVSLLGSTLANEDGSLPAAFERDFGSLASLVGILDAPADLEIVMAYKIVGDKAVLKSRAFRIPSSYDVIDLSQLTTRVERIAAAQQRVYGPGGRAS